MTAKRQPASTAPLHIVDIIRKKRDGEELSSRELAFVAEGAARGTAPAEQLAAWLMAAWLRGLSVAETHALALAMRDTGEQLDSRRLGRVTVDKHSTGGVGDKTSFLVAPIAAACGLAVPMISGRALGHTGGTLDKLEAIPGFRTALTLRQFESIVRRNGLAMMGQTPKLAPADRTLYALRDRTATVESAGLIAASILSKKLAAGLHGLVLDVKTGSGSSLKTRTAAENLAARMVAAAEAAGTRTVALLTDMGQPLGRAAGNWIELMECVELLRGEQPEGSSDLRALGLELAAWMLVLGGKAKAVPAGRQLAEAALMDGSALAVFLKMVNAQGGDVSVFGDPRGFHTPGATSVVAAWASGYVQAMDTTTLGWAVQRTGAGREKADAPVDPHAGVVFHAKCGERVKKGQALATIFASRSALLIEPEALVRQAIKIGRAAPEPVALIQGVITRTEAAKQLRHAVR